MTEASIPVELDRESAVSFTAQVANQLRSAILHGVLQPECVLPATRKMASELGISRGVVVRAFEQLSKEGFLESSGASGTKVAIQPGIQHSPLKDKKPERRLIIPDVIDLAPGRPADSAFAAREWRQAWKRALSEQGTTHLPSALGAIILREALARHLEDSRGLATEPEDIIITGGMSDALHLVVAMLRSRVERPRILVEDPGYPTSRRILEAAGAQLLTLPVDENGLKSSQLAALTDIPDAVLITPSHQYPLGGRMAVQARLGLLKWASQHGVLVLEDDYDSEFRHNTMPLPAVASLPTDAQVVLLGTFSKSLSPWLRSGYLVASGDAGRRLKAAREALGTPVAGLLQSALAHYIQGGGLSRHIARARREYSQRRALLMGRFGPRNDLELGGLDGGFHAVIRFQHPEAGILAAKALQRGVRVVPLADCFVHRPPMNGLILGYGAITNFQLAQSLDVIVDLLDESRSPTQSNS